MFTETYKTVTKQLKELYYRQAHAHHLDYTVILHICFIFSFISQSDFLMNFVESPLTSKVHSNERFNFGRTRVCSLK